MAKVSDTVIINTTPQKVFAFVSDPKRAPLFVPGLNRISNVSTEKPGVGRTWEFEFNWFGLTISGKTECIQYTPDSLYQFQTRSGASSKWTYRCAPSDAQTQLALEIDYELPENLLARIATRSALDRMNQNRVREAVANIKALLEP